MAISAFIPTVWEARYERILDRTTVYGNRTNTNFEGSISGAGDTVKIPFFATKQITISNYDEDGTLDASNDRTSQPEEVTGGTLDLSASTSRKQFAFLVEDVERVQSRPDLMDAAMQRAGVTSAQSVDTFLRGNLQRRGERCRRRSG